MSNAAKQFGEAATALAGELQAVAASAASATQASSAATSVGQEVRAATAALSDRLGQLQSFVTQLEARVVKIETLVAKPPSTGASPIPPPPTVPPAVPPAVPPTVPPASPPTVPSSAALRVIAPAEGSPRGDGVRNQSLSGVWIRGFSQNIVIDKPGDYVYSDGMSTDSWRRLLSDGSPHPYEGQGLYVSGDNQVTVRNWYFGSCGWQKTREAWEKSMFRHGAYVNAGSKPIIFENCIFEDSCAQALKLLRGSIGRNNFFTGNAIGISGIYGTHNWSETTMYGGGYYFDGAWTANQAICAYAPFVVDDLWIVGRTSLFVPPRAKPTPVFNMGVVACEKKHDQYNSSNTKETWPDVPGGTIKATNCVIAGWPKRTNDGAIFVGEQPHKGEGFRTFENPVSVDIEPIMRPIREGKVVVTAAIVRELSRIVRSAVR